MTECPICDYHYSSNRTHCPTCGTRINTLYYDNRNNYDWNTGRLITRAEGSERARQLPQAPRGFQLVN